MPTPSVDELILQSMRQLLPHATTRHVNEGEIIFHAGESGECFYGVLNGRVQLTWIDGGPAEFLGPGRVFGGGALVMANHERHGTATAIEPTQLIEMNRETFLFALQSLPMFGIELLASLEMRLEELRRQISDH